MRNRIYELRQQKNLTQKELAKKLNINHSVLSRIETNERPIKDDELLKIADFFNVSTDYLLGRSSNPHKNNKKTKVDELEEDFPEGISVLYRANQKLTPEQKDTMIRMIKATFFDDEDDNKSK
ncbi:helix-turn-helix domain-containing protein [Peptoniphilus duerdenii]|uniref:helix-turn-helix domain-containing protein n=1 Tax=Peptoniphilus duerdenii TaxID=507750 RepID=UPI00288B8C44|nr:helix-turn-helix transcriptional regulator [Peptoniphilus duerdenii]